MKSKTIAFVLVRFSQNIQKQTIFWFVFKNDSNSSPANLLLLLLTPTVTSCRTWLPSTGETEEDLAEEGRRQEYDTKEVLLKMQGVEERDTWCGGPGKSPQWGTLEMMIYEEGGLTGVLVNCSPAELPEVCTCPLRVLSLLSLPKQRYHIHTFSFPLYAE